MKGVELRDELGVQGHVMLWESMTRKQVIQEIRDLMAKWEAQGIHKLGQIPPGVLRDRFTLLNEVIGIRIFYDLPAKKSERRGSMKEKE